MFRLLLDQQVTRRKRWHMVADQTGHVHYASHRSSDCIDFLYVTGIHGFEIVSGKKRWYCRLLDHPPIVEQSPETGDEPPSTVKDPPNV